MIKKNIGGGVLNSTISYEDLLRDYKINTNQLKKGISKSPSLRVKTAGKIVKVAPLEKDFLYIRNRAISAGNVIDNPDGTCTLIPMDEYMKDFPRYAKVCRNANDNGDFFSHEELLKTYETFKGKALFTEHDDEDISKASGIILDAIYNPQRYFVELLIAVDKVAYPQLARGIEAKYMNNTSMGCRCESANCSICGHEAKTDDDVCDHVLNYKGSTFNGLPVFEINNGVEFFEDSIVATPADKNAVIMERIASRRKSARFDKFIPKNYHSSQVNGILGEKNQRSVANRIETMADKLKGLPWS